MFKRTIILQASLTILAFVHHAYAQSDPVLVNMNAELEKVPQCARDCAASFDYNFPRNLDLSSAIQFCNEAINIKKVSISQCLMANQECSKRIGELMTIWANLGPMCNHFVGLDQNQESSQPKLKKPVVVAIAVLGTFLFITVAGVVVLFSVRRRQKKSMPPPLPPKEDEFLVSYSRGDTFNLEPLSKAASHSQGLVTESALEIAASMPSSTSSATSAPLHRSSTTIFPSECSKAVIVDLSSPASEGMAGSSSTIYPTALQEKQRYQQRDEEAAQQQQPAQQHSELAPMDLKAPRRTTSWRYSSGTAMQISIEDPQPLVLLPEVVEGEEANRDLKAPQRSSSMNNVEGCITSWDANHVSAALINAGVNTGVVETLRVDVSVSKTAHRTDGAALLQLDHARLLTMGVHDAGARHVVLTAIGVVQDLHGVDLPPPEYS
ncbi:hypothetical protein HDU97_008532 [Phlyctochytrium planicorne]|nr:hypothetical protein HDU97_008532 [Phlyctochytrium planicorne]